MNKNQLCELDACLTTFKNKTSDNMLAFLKNKLLIIALVIIGVVFVIYLWKKKSAKNGKNTDYESDSDYEVEEYVPKKAKKKTVVHHRKKKVTQRRRNDDEYFVPFDDS